MDVSAFLRRVLPRSGNYFPYSKGLQPRGGCPTIRKTTDWFVGQEVNCHISLAAFEDRRGGRFKVARSFWADVDCGAGKPYPDQLTAYAALDAAIGKGLPPPLVLNSGNGLHLIWTLWEDMDERVWRRRADALKKVLRASGLIVDAQRTSDPSNGPRVPSSVNSKLGGVVGLARRSSPVWTGGEWDRQTERLFEDRGGAQADGCGDAEKVRSATPFESAGPLERRIAAKTPIEYDGPDIDFNGERIADLCSQMSALREGVPLSEPVWLSLLGVLAHCRGGSALAHEWSAKDERYDERETQAKLDYIAERGYKPATCEWFRSNGGGGGDRGLCGQCVQSCRSPIALGKFQPGTESHSNPGAPGGECTTEHSDKCDEGFVPPALPAGYRLARGNICTTDAEEQVIKICQEVYCVGHSEAGGKKFFTWAYKGRLGWEEFTLPASQSVAENAEFADRIHVGNPKSTNSYLTAAKYEVRDRRMADETRVSFGWNEERTEFLLGETIFSKGERRRAAALGPAASSLAEAMRVGGDLQTWRHAVQRLGALGQEASAFMVMLSAGTPLHSLISDEGGAMVVLRSHGSGHGKTTALAAASSVWGQWQGLANWSNSTKISNSGKWETAGHLPVPWDEANVADNEDFKARVLSFADGAPRERSSKNGVVKSNGRRWSSFLLATSNSDLRARLGTMAGATEGPVARIFQLETALDKKAVQEDGGALLTTFSRHYGHAGPAIVEALMNVPVEELEADLVRGNQARMKRLKLPSAARFACRAITCAEAGGRILDKLFGLNLDVSRIIRVVEEMLLKSIEGDAELRASSDLVGAFIRERIGEIVPVGPGMKERPLTHMSGRFELKDKQATLSVPVKVWAAWVAKHNKSEPEAEREAAARGHIMRRAMVDLAKDTNYPGEGKTRCVVIALDAVAALDAKDEMTKIVPIGRKR